MHLPRRRAPPPMFAFSIICLGYVLLSMMSTSSNAALDEGSSGVSIERLDPRLDALLGAENLAASFNAVDVLVRGRLWTEGPVFWPSENTLLFSDVRDNAIYSWREEEEEDTEKTKTEKGHGTSSPPGSVVAELVRPSGWLSASEAPMWEPGSNGLALDAFGNLVAAQHGERQIARLPLSEVLGGNNGSGRTFRAVASRFQGKRFNSPNDLAFNPLNGDLWFTDPVYGLEGYDDDPKKELMFQGVFRIPAAAYKEAVEGEPAAAAAAAADCAVTLEVSALSSPNGLAFSPDGETLFVSNSGKEASFWASFAVDRVSGRVVKKKENESDESVNSNNRTCPVSSLSAPSAGSGPRPPLELLTSVLRSLRSRRTEVRSSSTSPKSSRRPGQRGEPWAPATASSSTREATSLPPRSTLFMSSARASRRSWARLWSAISLAMWPLAEKKGKTCLSRPTAGSFACGRGPEGRGL